MMMHGKKDKRKDEEGKKVGRRKKIKEVKCDI